jgi:site-specific DNA-methyltransferase (adenine-specific)
MTTMSATEDPPGGVGPTVEAHGGSNPPPGPKADSVIKGEWVSPDGSVRLILGDCLQVLPMLSGIDAVVTDPPYGIGYQHSGGERANWRGRRGRYEATRKFDKIEGDDAIFDPEPLLAWPCLMWGADHYEDRLPNGSWLCWDKCDETGPDDSFVDGEFAWCSEKGIKRNVFRYLWKGLCCVKAGEDNGRRVHPTQKPWRLMAWCLGHVPGSMIVDPYMGSGTTGVACVRTGRRFVGIEIEPKYYAIAKRRIQAELSRFPLFEPQRQKQAGLFDDPEPATA